MRVQQSLIDTIALRDHSHHRGRDWSTWRRRSRAWTGTGPWRGWSDSDPVAEPALVVRAARRRGWGWIEREWRGGAFGGGEEARSRSEQVRDPSFALKPGRFLVRARADQKIAIGGAPMPRQNRSMRQCDWQKSNFLIKIFEIFF